jgi:phospholipase/carboxylesterase
VLKSTGTVGQYGGVGAIRHSLLAALPFLLWPLPLAAHDFAITDVLVLFKTDGTYQIDMTVDADALALGVAPTTDSAEVAAALQALSPAEFEVAVERARQTLLRRVRIRFDDKEPTPQIVFPEVEAPLAERTLPTVLGITARFVGRVPPSASVFTFGCSRAFSMVQLTILDQATTSGTRQMLREGVDCSPYALGQPPQRPRRAEVIARYVVLGFEHILPRGLDHMLFVLGLFLLSPRLRPLLWQITAFTVAHSVTLVLSMSGVVALPSRAVESLIALSIAYVALENVATSELKPWRPLLVFGFGLLHGLGFAGVLRELGLPEGEFVSALVAFNVGVELGQLAVVGLALAAVGWMQRRPWYRRFVVIPLSLLIAAVGLYWSVQRLSGGSLHASLYSRPMQQQELLETVERATGDKVRGSVIWLHGLGADGHDFEPIVAQFGGPLPHLRFVLPHAPVRPVTINGGMAMRAWFDVIALERGAEQDEAGVRQAAEQVRALIRRENERGIPCERILLAGFSQGGAIALHTGLRHPERLAGIIGLSTLMPLHWTVEAEAHAANRATPIFLAHGSFDPLVPESLGLDTRNLLQERGYNVEWRTYPMPHAVCDEEIDDLRTWIGREAYPDPTS